MGLILQHFSQLLEFRGGVKCKQADSVSIYTSFCIEVNKDGQGRGLEKPGSEVC